MLLRPRKIVTTYRIAAGNADLAQEHPIAWRGGKDFLRLASGLAVAPSATRFLQEVFEAFGVRKSIHEIVLEALDQADALSLCGNRAPTAELHSLVSRMVRFKLGDHDRIERLKTAAVEVLIRHFTCRRCSQTPPDR
jgi:hypothetical protein